RGLFLRVKAAHRLEVGNLALPGDQQHGARYVAFGDPLIELLGDALEPLRGEPNALGRCARQWFRHRGKRKEDDKEQGRKTELGPHGVVPQTVLSVHSLTSIRATDGGAMRHL